MSAFNDQKEQFVEFCSRLSKGDRQKFVFSFGLTPCELADLEKKVNKGKIKVKLQAKPYSGKVFVIRLS